MEPNKLYLIRTVNVQDEQKEAQMVKLLEMFIPEHIKSKVATIELEDQEIFIPFLSENKANELIYTFKTLGILLDVKEITASILMGEAMTTELSELFSETKFDLLRQKFIADNLTKDLVLDKISTKGIDSLTDIDYKILNS